VHDQADAQESSPRNVPLKERQRDIERFLAANPGIDISSLRPRAFRCYTCLPAEECSFCRGGRDGRRCLGSAECLFRYRAGFFTRQGGICPWCRDPLPASLNTFRYRGPAVSMDHIIPMTRGGPVHAEWNKQLVHDGCNASKSSWVTDAALALAIERGVEVLDFAAVSAQPAPRLPTAVVHLFPPLRLDRTHGCYVSSLTRIGHRHRTLCGKNLGIDWFPVHGSPPPATCGRCQERRGQLGPGNAPACPGACCSTGLEPLPGHTAIKRRREDATMSDPNETANLAGQLIQGYREHKAREAGLEIIAVPARVLGSDIEGQADALEDDAARLAELLTAFAQEPGARLMRLRCSAA
jgi:hypothetical protein